MCWNLQLIGPRQLFFHQDDSHKSGPEYWKMEKLVGSLRGSRLRSYRKSRYLMWPFFAETSSLSKAYSDDTSSLVCAMWPKEVIFCLMVLFCLLANVFEFLAHELVCPPAKEWTLGWCNDSHLSVPVLSFSVVTLWAAYVVRLPLLQ